MEKYYFKQNVGKEWLNTRNPMNSYWNQLTYDYELLNQCISSPKWMQDTANGK